jgi:very-short-patch-repair endonuclease
MTTSLRTEPQAAEALHRHERRRGLGLPTVSVIAGLPGVALWLARSWSEARGRSVVRVTDPDADAALASWGARLAAEQDLPARAVAWLARRLGRPEPDLGPRLRRMTPFEREVYLDNVLTDAASTGLDLIARRLLARPPTDPLPAPGALVEELVDALGAVGLPRPRLATALLELVLPDAAPILMIQSSVRGGADASILEVSAELAAALVEAEPGLTVLLAVGAEELVEFLGRPPDSRTKALLRESIIHVPVVDGTTFARRLDAARPGLAAELAGPLTRLAADGATEELAASFVAAARALDEASGQPAKDDGARSAAERFLYERLESLPETAGQFRLNARPGFRFGPSRPMEVDLLAEALRLAVEVDGYYHFRDADAYRRDRRKDLEFQRRGFLVVRVLAEDVVRRLEEILETILDAVAHQARSSPRS